MDAVQEALSATLSRDEARRRATRLLAAASGAEAFLDARILVEETTGLDRAALLLEGDRPLGVGAAVRLAAMVRRRLGGEPVWRILGRREFWGLSFAVTPAVLDPRPDTETIVAAALAAVAARRTEPLRIADLGTGSGAILGALLSELPRSLGWGVDRSEDACRVARGNLDALGLGERALVLTGDWARALRSNGLDLVVSNPPYIATGDLPALDREVRDHDPRAALDGGADGLAAYRAIAADLPRLLAPDGVAVLEVGAGQAPEVGRLLATSGLTIGPVRRDLGGHERAVSARPL